MYSVFYGKPKEELSVEEKSKRLMKAMEDEISGEGKPVQNEIFAPLKLIKKERNNSKKKKLNRRVLRNVAK
ncbi:hypothetical protein [Vibrio crassostreae]|uniref:hypothetical protein n=1 Tax=Vibrio crassostreae TaxID=246167 RepID=UPI001B30BD4A|nr:hypothetical protein [Vibrio crassostreae]